MERANSPPRCHIGMLPGPRAIAERPGIARRVLVYGVKRTFQTGDGIDVRSRRHPRRVIDAPASY